MKIVSANVTGSFILNGVDLTTTVESSSIWSGSIASRVSNLEQFSSSLDSTYATDVQLNAVTQSVNTLSSSFLSYTSSTDDKIAQLYRETSSLNFATASLNAATASLYTATASLNSYTSSNTMNIVNLFATSASLNAAVADIRNTTASLFAATASIYNATSSLNAYTASTTLRINALDQYTASLNTRSASFACVDSTNNFACTQYFSNISNAVSFTSTGSLYSDGGIRITKDMYVSGTAFFNNVTVFGTQSINYISSSQLNIASNIISVNTATPTVRFGGLAVYDSGSLGTGLTGSLLWDSEDNQWIYSNPSGSTYDSALFLVGPRNSGVLGNETGISCNFLSKGNGMHHMTSSGIFEDGSKTCFYGNSRIDSSGAACFGGTVCTGLSVVNAMNGAAINILGDETLNSNFGITWTTPTYNGGIAAIRAARRGALDAADLMFFTSPNGDMPNERLRIASDGVSCFSNRICATTGAAFGNIVSYSYGSIRGYVGDTDGDCNMQVRAECALTIKTGGNNTRMTITPSGCVGIGTSTPTSLLNIQSTSSNTLLTITNCFPASGAGDTTGTSGIVFQQYGNYISPTIRNAGKILSVRECNYSTDGLANSSLIFYTATNNTDTARLTIDSLGNACFSTAVGINGPVLSSSYALTVWGCAVMYRNCDFIFHQPNGYTNGIAWKNTGYTKDSAAIRPISTGAYAIQGLGFYTGNFSDNSTAPVLRLGISPDGNSYFNCPVGINIGSPAAILDVRAHPQNSCLATLRIGTQCNGGDGDEFANLEFYWGDPDAAEVKAKIFTKNTGNVGPGGGGAASLIFATRTANAGLCNRFSITSDGISSFCCTVCAPTLITSGNVCSAGTVQSNTQIYVIGCPPANNGGLMNVRDCFANNSNVTFAGTFYNSAPGNDFSVGKLTCNTNGFLQIRNANNGCGFLVFDGSGISTFNCQVCVPRIEILRSSANNGLFVYSNSGATAIGCTMVQINGLTNDSTGNILTLGSLNDGIRTVFRNDGNVGIGMTNPQVPLHIIKALGNDVFSIGESGTNTRFTIGQEASYTGNYINSRNIDLKLQAYCAGGSGGNIHFQTGTDGTGCVTTKMFICSIGNVGIGTTNPSYKLDICTTQSIRVVGSSTGYTQGSIIFQSSTADTPEARGLGVYAFNEGTDATWFYGTAYNAADSFVINRKSGTTYQDSAASVGEASTFLLINNSGKVGIGCASPGVTLTIGGTDALRLPTGTTAQRPTTACSLLRFNTDLRLFEGSGADNWGALGIQERIIMNNYDPYSTTPQALCIVDNADGGGTTWTFNGSGIFGVTNSSGGHSGQWGPMVYMTPGAWRWRWTAIPTVCDGSIHPSTPAAAYKCTIQVSFNINGVSTDNIKYDTCVFFNNMHIGGVSTPTYITTAGCFTVSFSTNGYEGVRKIWFKELVLEKLR